MSFGALMPFGFWVFALFGVCFAMDRPPPPVLLGFVGLLFLDLGGLVFICKLLGHFTCIALLDSVSLL